MNRKTTIWLGSDDGDPDGMSGYGYEVSREDSMVSIVWTAQLGVDHEETLEVFILPDLFPKIRKAMAAAEATVPGRKPKRRGGPKG